MPDIITPKTHPDLFDLYSEYRVKDARMYYEIAMHQMIKEKVLEYEREDPAIGKSQAKTKAAAYFSVSRNFLYGVMSGREEVTQEMAKRLGYKQFKVYEKLT